MLDFPSNYFGGTVPTILLSLSRLAKTVAQNAHMLQYSCAEPADVIRAHLLCTLLRQALSAACSLLI